jgi:chromosome segregation ATPase
MLLDDLMAERARAQVEVAPPPVLTVEPVAVPPTGEVGRREARQRLLELEDVARRNLRSAEEARHVLAEEHRRLELESSARSDAENEAAALRREVDRLRDDEEQRNAQAKTRATREARAEMAQELEQARAQHDQVVDELNRVRASIGEHDTLLQEYGSHLREEQQARAAMRGELDRAIAERELAEKGLARATDDAKRHAEDSLIQVASLHQELADLRLERDQLTARVAELSSEDHAARAEELDGRVLEAEERAREAERQQGRMRRESSENAKARRDAEEELVRARADSDRLREHAAALGDELAALRETVAVLQSAPPAPDVHEPEPEPEPESEPPSNVVEGQFGGEAPPPLERRHPKTADAAPGVRRHAMAELTALAAHPDDDFSYRRR